MQKSPQKIVYNSLVSSRVLPEKIRDIYMQANNIRCIFRKTMTKAGRTFMKAHRILQKKNMIFTFNEVYCYFRHITQKHDRAFWRNMIVLFGETLSCKCFEDQEIKFLARKSCKEETRSRKEKHGRVNS